jgi:hypothetical protein
MLTRRVVFDWAWSGAVAAEIRKRVARRRTGGCGI